MVCSSDVILLVCWRMHLSTTAFTALSVLSALGLITFKLPAVLFGASIMLLSSVLAEVGMVIETRIETASGAMLRPAANVGCAMWAAAGLMVGLRTTIAHHGYDIYTEIGCYEHKHLLAVRCAAARVGKRRWCREPNNPLQ